MPDCSRRRRPPCQRQPSQPRRRALPLSLRSESPRLESPRLESPRLESLRLESPRLESLPGQPCRRPLRCRQSWSRHRRLQPRKTDTARWLACRTPGLLLS